MLLVILVRSIRQCPLYLRMNPSDPHYMTKDTSNIADDNLSKMNHLCKRLMFGEIPIAGNLFVSRISNIEFNEGIQYAEVRNVDITHSPDSPAMKLYSCF